MVAHRRARDHAAAHDSPHYCTRRTHKHTHAGHYLKTDCSTTDYFILNNMQDIQQFLGAYSANNKKCFTSYEAKRLEQVLAWRVPLPARLPAPTAQLHALLQADWLMYCTLKHSKQLKQHQQQAAEATPPAHDAASAGQHAISMLAKKQASIVSLHVVTARRNDNFASEMMNVYKTAIGALALVDAPPCCKPALRLRFTRAPPAVFHACARLSRSDAGSRALLPLAALLAVAGDPQDAQAV